MAKKNSVGLQVGEVFPIGPLFAKLSDEPVQAIIKDITRKGEVISSLVVELFYMDVFLGTRTFEIVKGKMVEAEG